MRDFTLTTYRLLLHTLRQVGYKTLTFEDYCRLRQQGKEPDFRFVILRHDVDLKPQNSLLTAKIEAELGLSASYYFRIVPESNQPEYIRDIAALGHEIGYHYEDLSLAHGDCEQAIKHFEQALAYFRQFYDVKTICMHGAPTSRYDGRDLWKKYHYADYGIIGEPYLVLDYAKVFYLTDTGRRWDGYKVSVRDKIPVYQDEWNKRGWTFRRTEELVNWLTQTAPDQLPNMMMTTHPQRWTNNPTAWWKELILQNTKNCIKRGLILCGNV